MSRWIDADELMRLLQNYRPFVESGRLNELQIQANQLVDCIEYEIEDAPSIDIVRCKECTHREEYPCKVYHNDDWYCADGERKESE